MSFILEALKRSEKKREETVVPNLHTVHGSSHPVPKKKPLWPYLVVAGLLLNAGILFWFLAHWENPPATTVPAMSADVPTEPPAFAVAPLAQPLTPAPASEPTLSLPVTVVVEPPAVVATAEGPAVVAAPTSAPPVAEVATTDLTEVAPVGPPAEDRWEDERTIEDIADLPYEVQRRLPEIHLSVYAYSNDVESRLVRVNNRILREGSYLDVGLLLDEITPNGLIFTFEGYRFWVPKQ